MADKTYLPESIGENPFPVTEDVFIPSESAIQATPDKEDQQLSPQISIQKKFPNKIIARETLSESLNTKEKKILGSYEFGVLGAIQVGKYVNGTSGDLKVTPDGITARNVNGDTTFSLDGTTGDATFRGEVAAADFLIADENGLISLNNFNYGSITLTSQPVFTPGDNDWHDITGLSQTITTVRNVNALFLMSVAGLPDAGSVNIRMFITGISLTDIPTVELLDTVSDSLTWTHHRVYEIGTGTITYKLQYRCNAPATQIQINPSTSTFIVFGS